MLQLDATATAARLSFEALIPALRRAFAEEGCEVPLRHTHRIADPAGAGGSVLLMPAWKPGGLFGLKTVMIFPGNGARGLPGLHSLYTLFDASTGVPLAQLDGNTITSRRTAAAAALAASFLAREDAARLLVLGCGRVARLLPEAMRCVRPITRVQVWNHRPEGALALAREWREQGIDVQAVTDLDAAVHEADIVSCATLASAPLVRGAQLREGTHLDLIGSFTPQMRECDAACFARSRVFVDTEEALAKSGDVLGAVAEGAFEAARLQGTLAQLVRGERAGRREAGEITLFKAVGNALEDLAAAELVAAAMLGR
ncbi:ornithine cyclodeaminase family protein [Piscinibacter sp.]|uniref:ornithine cyclodeaminase family protein n=1 Tax=Piscinibacter sp. TaxID=1903157 RepID=UPI0037843E79